MGEPILSKQHWKRVFRMQGWTTAVVVVDGIIKGVWDYKANGAQTTVKVEMFDPPTKSIQKGIEAEAARLGAFLNTAMIVEYGPIK
jgi:hypothetical protein